MIGDMLAHRSKYARPISYDPFGAQSSTRRRLRQQPWKSRLQMTSVKCLEFLRVEYLPMLRMMLASSGVNICVRPVYLSVPGEFGTNAPTARFDSVEDALAHTITLSFRMPVSSQKGCYGFLGRAATVI